MPYDYSKLRGKIVEIFGSNGAFAKVFPMSERTLSKKMTGKVGWSQKQMKRACELLSIEEQELPAYFFKQKV